MRSVSSMFSGYSGGMMMARPDRDVSVDVVHDWARDFSSLWERAGRCFRRRDTRGHAEGYLRALLGRMERKNSWQMAEYLGAEHPYPVQHFLGRANWSADTLRDEVLRYSCEHLTTSRESGVLIVDETGFLKKGDKSVGVQRQYSGTAGRIENCQIGVFLALASSKGRALIDRELYMPKLPGVRKRQSPKTWHSRPSSGWLKGCCPALLRAASRRTGCWRTRCTVPTASSAFFSKSVGNRMYWR